MVDTIIAKLREGKVGAIRRSDEIPAIIYGGDKKLGTVHIQITGGEPKPNVKHKLVYTENGREVTESVMVLDVQRRPVGNSVLHIDFLRVDDNTEVTIPVAVRYLGQDKSKAIKMEGASLGIAVSRVKVKCALKDVPKLLEANITNLKIGQTFYATDLPLPQGVRLANEKMVLAIATMNKPRGGVKEA